MTELHPRPGPMGGTIATMRRAVLVTVVLIGLLVAACTTADAPQPVESPTQPGNVVQSDISRAETPRDSFAVNPSRSDQWSVARITPDGRTIWVVVPASPVIGRGLRMRPRPMTRSV